MTFLSWANSRKWYDWMAQGVWFVLSVFCIANMEFALALLWSTIIFMVTAAEFIIANWKHRAHAALDVLVEYSRLMDEALKYVPADKQADLLKKHNKLCDALRNA